MKDLFDSYGQFFFKEKRKISLRLKTICKFRENEKKAHKAK